MSKKAPGILERALQTIGLVPRRLLKAESKRAYEIGFQAAAMNRLTNNWASSTLSIDSIAQTQLPTLRARCRILADQNDYALKFLRMVKNNVVGPEGIQLKNKAMDPPRARQEKPKPDTYANRIIEDAWWEFSKRGNCTVDRQMSLCDLENLCAETIARDGEILIRKVRGFNNRNRFALQIIETDYLDTDKNEKFTNGGEIRMGVELNEWREPVAYWLRTANPNDTLASGGRDQRWERVPASEIIHPFIRIRPEQTRGIPWMAASAYRLNMLGKYEEAEVTAARVAACKQGFFVKQNANQEYTGEDDGAGNKMMDAEPGAFEELPYGMDVKTVDWNHPNSSYQVFMKTCLRGVAAGLGVSYNMLANDMESVNFASGKLGLEEERDYWKVLQRWFIDSVVNEIFREWLEVQLMTGAIPLPFSKFEKFNAPDWRPRRWTYINPQQEVASKIDQVKAGFTSISRVLAEQGLDRDEVFAEIAEDNAAAEALDIELPGITDPYIEVEKEKVEAQADAAESAASETQSAEDRNAERISKIICESHQNIAKTSQETARQMAELLLAARKKTHKVTGRDEKGQINAFETVEE